MRQRNLVLVANTLGLTLGEAEAALARVQARLGDDLFDCEGNVCLPREKAFSMWPAIQDLLATWHRMVDDPTPKQPQQEAANAPRWQQEE